MLDHTANGDSCYCSCSHTKTERDLLKESGEKHRDVRVGIAYAYLWLAYQLIQADAHDEAMEALTIMSECMRSYGLLR